MQRKRVALIADLERKGMAEIAGNVRTTIARYADITAELHPFEDNWPADLEIDLAVVIGGDGTLIHLCRRLVDRNVPLIGINTGRLGFLAEFDPGTLKDHAAVIFGDDPPLKEQMMLETHIRDTDGHPVRSDTAINDVAIAAGLPFKMIELRLMFDDVEGPILSGDGVIVASPVGSTAYNASAGGPIVHPSLEAMVITPLAAHSLAFRSILIRPDTLLRIKVRRANQGTSCVVDGNVLTTLEEGWSVDIAQHEKKPKVVQNPATSYWTIVKKKLRWAAPPNYRTQHRSS